KKKTTAIPEKSVILHRQTTKEATALGHRHPKVRRGIEPLQTLPNNQGRLCIIHCHPDCQAIQYDLTSKTV
ncbi:MAG: hypothetical protein IKJ40_00720, partial [Bacteroidales bacterium]|nr:hypothetical protein [Bacteroidales bacterium]